MEVPRIIYINNDNQNSLKSYKTGEHINIFIFSSGIYPAYRHSCISTLLLIECNSISNLQKYGWFKLFKIIPWRIPCYRATHTLYKMENCLGLHHNNEELVTVQLQYNKMAASKQVPHTHVHRLKQPFSFTT